eukprot:TRINITY_DN8378_c0_g1_i1.p1 TRINITY_DN8378_c0_g1~~TRINITY_DN8378_c0_g1_i1.p1  ORF type:complete len:190 (-),score=28.42 TRINITY_DN8378_c0_g1_i1:136-705(-)
MEQPKPPVVWLGSTSVIKRAAIVAAFGTVWPSLSHAPVTVHSLAVPSNVNEQPTNEETLQGAVNRVKNLRAALESKGEPYDYVLAIESGVYKHQLGLEDLWMDVGWVVIENHRGARGVGLSTGIHVPTSIMTAASEKGYATTTFGDILAAQEPGVDTKDPHKFLTQDLLPRQSTLVPAVVSAITDLLRQ